MQNFLLILIMEKQTFICVACKLELFGLFLHTENNDDGDKYEEKKVADLQETKMFTSSEESIADEELQRWMIGVDMIEDSYDMLLNSILVSYTKVCEMFLKI